MPTEKAAIAEALQSLDQKNDALWTDDGSPLVAELQRICNDKTITRAQINDALPGFARKGKDSVAEDQQPGDEPAAEGSGGAPQTDAAPGPAPVLTSEQIDDLSPEQNDERLRGIAHQRVIDAEVHLGECKERVSEAQREVVQAERRHARALQIYSSKYPAMTPAQAIKVHLARQQEIRREMITGSRFEPNVAQSPVDATLMDRKRDNGRKGNPTAPYLPRKAALNY